MPKARSRLYFLATSMLTFLIAGCAAQPAPTATKAPTPTLGLSATPSASASPAATAQPFTDCQKLIDEQFPADFLTEGSIIFRGECAGKYQWYKLSSFTRKVTPFLEAVYQEEEYLYSQVSDDHQWMLVQKTSQDANDEYLGATWIFTGEDDLSTVQYPVRRDWNVTSWHKNDQLGISSGVHGSFTKFLLDPLTGKVSKFDYFLEGFTDGLPDPTLNDAVYLNSSHFRYTNFLLKNLKTGQTIWQNPMEPEKGYASYPAWSPDGKYFATALWQEDGGFKLMVVDLNGKETLSADVFYSDEASTYAGIGFQWSSTGKYISFLTKSDDGKEQQVLWVPETNQVLYPGIRAMYRTYPNFSPDDQKFIVDIDDGNGKYHTVLVNLASGKTTVLNFDLEVLGWLKTTVPMEKTVSEPSLLAPKSAAGVKQIHPQVQMADGSKLKKGLVFSRGGLLYTFTLAGEQKIADTMLAYLSPNRKNLFYWYEDENGERHYWLYQASGQASEIVTDQIRLGYPSDVIGGWQSDDELWVKTRDYDTGPLFNPFKNSFRSTPVFKQVGPEMMLCWVYCRAAGDPPAWLYENYDKALERYIYIADALIMQDIAGNLLWRYDKGWFGFRMPQWSPDDQKIGVPLPLDEGLQHYEIFTVDRKGRQTQLTDYAKAYPAIQINQFSWSPNGRYIAFWADTHSQENIAQQNPYRLFVLDTITRQTTDYDLASGYSNWMVVTPAPIWSLDGRRIAMTGILNGVRQMLMLDIASASVTPVGDGELVGWIVAK